MRDDDALIGDQVVSALHGHSMFDVEDAGDGAAGLFSDTEAHAPIAQAADNPDGLRGLLAEARRKIAELDDAKACFVRIVDEAENSLRDIEEEKSRNVSMARMLGESRASFAMLQDKFESIEGRITTCERDNELLRCELEAMRHAAQEVHQGKEALARDLDQRRAVADQRTTEFAEAIKARAAASAEKPAKPAVAAVPVAVEAIPAVVAEAPVAKPDAVTAASLKDLKAALHQERLERAYAEGALEAQRHETAQLQRDLMKLRVAVKVGKELEAPAEPARLRDDVASGRGIHAA